MKAFKVVAALFYVNCIVQPGLTICYDSSTGQSWTIITSGGN